MGKVLLNLNGTHRTSKWDSQNFNTQQLSCFRYPLIEVLSLSEMLIQRLRNTCHETRISQEDCPRQQGEHTLWNEITVNCIEPQIISPKYELRYLM